MKVWNKKSYYLLALLLLSALACETDPADQQITNYSDSDQSIGIEQRTFTKASAYCQTDSTHCMRIRATYPYLVSGPLPILQAINDTIAYHLKANLAVFAVESSEFAGSLDSIADAYIQDFEQLIQETPDYPFAWEIEVEGSAMHQSNKVLSVALNAYSYTGGAHPNIFLDLINFDLSSGKKLSLADIFSDEDQLKALVEKKFREVREIESSISIVDAGFFWGDAFSLPQNFALQEEGVYFHYNPYEAAAYALGATEFTIPYDDLKGVMRQP